MAVNVEEVLKDLREEIHEYFSNIDMDKVIRETKEDMLKNDPEYQKTIAEIQELKMINSVFDGTLNYTVHQTN